MLLFFWRQGKVSMCSFDVRLIQRIGSMLFSFGSPMFAKAARPRYECRISGKDIKLDTEHRSLDYVRDLPGASPGILPNPPMRCCVFSSK